MAFKVVDSAVRMSKGRGAAAVSLDISFREIETWAKRNKVDTDRLFRRSFGRACSALKRQLVQIMQQGGGLHGVPKFRDFEDFTKELRTVNKMSGPMGGILADKGSIVAFKRNGWQVIGWPDGNSGKGAKKSSLEFLAKAFQDGAGGTYAEAKFTDPQWRAAWHRKGIAVVPRGYVHNPRPIIEPYWHEHVRLNLDDWATKIYYKDLAKQMAKTGSVKL